MERALLLSCIVVAAGCGGGSITPDAGATRDGGADAASPIDAHVPPPTDAGRDAHVPTDAAIDAANAPDGGPPDGGGGGGCATDADCEEGSEWCEGGSCVACDNDGLACRIACPAGWSLYTRNGCHPCACAPENDCTSDGECHTGDKCYAGAFCWDWCPPGDSSCCYGNVCSAPGCAPPPPVGCARRGCPSGERCDLESGCASSGCFCSDDGWSCTPDCGGGVCVPDV